MSSYSATLNRLKKNVINDHPKLISGGGGSIVALKRKTNALSIPDSNSLAGPRNLNNFSIIKRKLACCVPVKNGENYISSGEKTDIIANQLYNRCGTNSCDVGPQYTGKTYGVCDNGKCMTVKDVAVARDYNDRLRRLRAGNV